jgi:hypothetical protein
MTLHPHQHRALVAELRRPEYAGLSADDAFAMALSRMKALGRTRFLTRERFESMPEKRRPAEWVELSAEEATAFPTGVPGFPNKLSREWFDAAWREAGGTA